MFSAYVNKYCPKIMVLGLYRDNGQENGNLGPFKGIYAVIIGVYIP